MYILSSFLLIVTLEFQSLLWNCNQNQWDQSFEYQNNLNQFHGDQNAFRIEKGQLSEIYSYL